MVAAPGTFGPMASGDAHLGQRGYVGVSAPFPGTFDMSWRAERRRGRAFDLSGSFAFTNAAYGSFALPYAYPLWLTGSPGFWFGGPVRGTLGRTRVGVRLAPHVSLGDWFGTTTLGVGAGGLGLRLDVAQDLPRGTLRLDVDLQASGLLGRPYERTMTTEDGEVLGQSIYQIGLYGVLTVSGDIPVGRHSALVLGVASGVMGAVAGDADPFAVPMLRAVVGGRFGRPREEVATKPAAPVESEPEPEVVPEPVGLPGDVDLLAEPDDEEEALPLDDTDP